MTVNSCSFGFSSSSSSSSSPNPKNASLTSAEKFSLDGSCGNGVSEGAGGSTSAGEGSLPTVSAVASFPASGLISEVPV